ncbi:MAG: PAS domain-containing sensor histidine kinase [Methanoregula sp.]|nr:PAS domain-containing sensor histidine kinase [Methanoregula sp.]
MRPISREKKILYDIFIVLSILASIAITYISITRGIYDVFPYFYLIPVVLIAYSRPKISIFVTVLVGWLYIGLVYSLGLPDTGIFARATVWFFIFVSIGVLISTYSREYRKEGERSCGSFFNSQAGAFSYDREKLFILDPNQKFSQFIGYHCDLLLSKTLPEIITDTTERELFLSKIRDTLRVGDIEVKFTCADGSNRWALVSAMDCAEPAIHCTAVDITEQKQAQDALRLANRKLNLLNNVTRHDILNQLTGLIGYLELSRDDIKDPRLLTYVTKEEQAANAIRNQILFTRDYQNIGVHSPQWHNIAETVSLAMATLDIHLIKVTVNLAAVEVYADPLLEKVFYNLIENTLRHGEKVTDIEIGSEFVSDGIDIIIEDNGAGIPDDAKERIFRREYFKNTGFGLFLTREILAITNLSITENGTFGKGARFVIHAPLGTFRSMPGERTK